jgi:hypothetical protein
MLHPLLQTVYYLKKACGREKEKRLTRSNERSTVNRRIEKAAIEEQTKMRFNSDERGYIQLNNFFLVRFSGFSMKDLTIKIVLNKKRCKSNLIIFRSDQITEILTRSIYTSAEIQKMESKTLKETLKLKVIKLS